MAKKIIVIGSGFGGLAAALRLKAKGYKVTLVEKHPDLGGRARVFKKGEFIYDGGPTVITAPYLFEELFKLFNKDISDYVKIVPLDLWYRFVFNDGESFDYNGDSISMEEQVKKFNPDDYKGYKKLVNFTKKIFDKGFTDLSDKPFNNLIFMIKQIPSLLKLKSYRSVYSLVSSFISNEKLRRVFSMHPLVELIKEVRLNVNNNSNQYVLQGQHDAILSYNFPNVEKFPNHLEFEHQYLCLFLCLM